MIVVTLLRRGGLLPKPQQAGVLFRGTAVCRERGPPPFSVLLRPDLISEPARPYAGRNIIRFRRFPKLSFLQTGGSRQSEKGRIGLKQDPDTDKRALPGARTGNAEDRK